MKALRSYFHHQVGVAGVERWLLLRQERQLTAEAREHMGDHWHLPWAPPDRKQKPALDDEQPKPAGETQDAEPESETNG